MNSPGNTNYQQYLAHQEHKLQRRAEAIMDFRCTPRFARRLARRAGYLTGTVVGAYVDGVVEGVESGAIGPEWIFGQAKAGVKLLGVFVGGVFSFAKGAVVGADS